MARFRAWIRAAAASQRTARLHAHGSTARTRTGAPRIEANATHQIPLAVPYLSLIHISEPTRRS
eukprot:6510072-Prymnesium_polylepis.2